MIQWSWWNEILETQVGFGCNTIEIELFRLSWFDRYETEDKIKVEETGSQKQIGDESGTVAQGSYSFEYDGVTYTVNWIADENGFQATGDHLPKRK